MSSSKVIWSSPLIARYRNIYNAKQLNETSIHCLKFQIFFFIAIISEICLNLLLKIFGGGTTSIYIYTLICKTLLSINLVFILSYAYQILQARYQLYVETRPSKSESILKSIIFELYPNGRTYYEKLVKSKWLSHWMQKEAIEREQMQTKLDEERRKTLYQMYLPSMHSQNSYYRDVSMKRETSVPSESWCSAYNQDSMYRTKMGHSMDHMAKGVFDANMMSVKTSTPYTKREEEYVHHSPYLAKGYVNSEYASLQSPIQYAANDRSTRSPCAYNDSWMHSSDMISKYQPSPSSSPHPMQLHSPTSLFAPHRNQFCLLPEVSAHDVWKSLDVDIKKLDQLTLNMRQWLHGTILSRVVQEVDKLNAAFVQMGISDVVIGESNIQSLRHLANLPGNNFPTLNVLINFLDCSKDQGYVVNRIKELSQGVSIGKFQWDSGSNSARYPWKEHLPNDSMLILHLLSTYTDSHANSNLHGAKTFSQQFIIDSLVNKDPADLKDACCILQVNVQPPHFKVIVNQAIYDISPGRKNLFECLIVCFYKIYKDESNLRWLNLGRSGLNMNWIFDDCN